MDADLVNILKVCLNNCKLIKQNKDLIISNISKGVNIFSIDDLITFTDEDLFNGHVALCANANLFLLNDYHLYSLNLGDDECYKLIKENKVYNVLDYFAYNFILKEYNISTKRRDYAFPVANTRSKPLWLNEDRWKYVDFMIDNITEILKKLEA